VSARKPKSKRGEAPTSEQSGVHSKPSEAFTTEEAGTAPSMRSEADEPGDDDHLGPAETLDLLAVQFDAVHVLQLAACAFETGQEVNDMVSTSILRNALRCATEDMDAIELLASDGAETASHFIRARARCHLAVALAEFQAKHGLLTREAKR
jgi:hypothetical protein